MSISYRGWQIMEALQERCEAIIGGSGYARAQKLQRVDLYTHEWKGDGTEVNDRTVEKIILRTLDDRMTQGGSSGDTVAASGEIQHQMDIFAEWVLLGDTASERDLAEVRGDFEQALWKDFGGSGLGLLARSISLQSQPTPPQQPIVTGGVSFFVSILYVTEMGDPTKGD